MQDNKDKAIYPYSLKQDYELVEERVDNTLVRTFEDDSKLVSTFSTINYQGEEVETITYNGESLYYLYWGLPE